MVKVYLTNTEKCTWGFMWTTLKTPSVSSQKPQPSSTGGSKPNPALHINYSPTCFLRNVDLALF